MRQLSTADGSAGTVGLLDLHLARIGGATRVTRQFQRTPLYILHPIYLDPGRPGMAFVYLQHQGDGMLQGDRYRMDFDVADGTDVHLTTQAATKIYRMEAGYAAQLVNISAGAGSFVEYLPEPVIPYRHSRFAGRLTVTAHPQATVLLAETLLPGRVARGEWHAYDLYCATTRIRRPDGRQIIADTLSFGGTYDRAGTPARLGEHGVHAAFFALAPPERTAGLHTALLAGLGESGEVLAGVSTLPFDAGIVARLLGPSSIPVRRALHTAWDIARRHLKGAPAPDLRKG
ncbi:urease accessory protein UreD [Couchioplanes caeruleus]|uniref:urease accessory protein UreD n=1 Tax=Couchioplanes caeruleus TaxID=56438 RepID=UPI00201CABB6|nr:urease accessory protein UreD [Couchioplanes caeruleus]UQU67589.1 urease accessory protein UreD [Couchioplanes caeruleus]